MSEVVEPAIPAFLKPVHKAPNIIVERVEGERRFCWFRDDETADLHGEWTAQELWQIADMMSPEPDGLAGRGA